MSERLLGQSGTQSDVYTVTYTQKYPGTKFDEILPHVFEKLGYIPAESSFDSNWEKKIDEYNKHHQAVIFVESPPGAGKTHLMDGVMADARAKVIIVIALILGKKVFVFL